MVLLLSNLAITPPLEVLLNDGSLLGDEQTQLNLEGPIEFDALLRTYYGFVERDGTSFLSSLTIGSSGGTQVGVWYRGWLVLCMQLHTDHVSLLISKHHCSPS